MIARNEQAQARDRAGDLYSQVAVVPAPPLGDTLERNRHYSSTVTAVADSRACMVGCAFSQLPSPRQRHTGELEPIADAK